MKRCIKCDVAKAISEFRFIANTDKHCNRCKECTKSYLRQYYFKNKEKLKEYHKQWTKENKNKCKKSQKKYYDNNVEKISEQGKKYRDNNKDKERARHRKYMEKNREIINKKRTALAREKRENDSQFKLHANVSRSIRHHLTKNGGNKNKNSIAKILPYTMQELKTHLEFQFELWMGWKNYGNYRKESWDDNNSATWTWQIDHIIPQSKLKFKSADDPKLLECWALKNLRPLSAKENILKGDK